jgi:3',5'-cyclic-AMP phosphodiesterase
VLLGDADGGDGPVNQVHHLDAVTVLLCDSTVPGQAHGYLADETVGWLDATLATAPDRPVLVAMHHPPVDLGIPLVDAIRQRDDGRRLRDVLRRHRQVVALLCGHAHTAASSLFAGRQLLVAPGVASTALLPTEQPDPDGQVLDGDAPAAIAFHLWDGGRLTTHFRVVG